MTSTLTAYALRCTGARAGSSRVHLDHDASTTPARCLGVAETMRYSGNRGKAWQGEWGKMTTRAEELRSENARDRVDIVHRTTSADSEQSSIRKPVVTTDTSRNERT